MKQLAHSIDSCHWERLREKSRAGRNKSDHSDKPNNKNKSDDKGKTLAPNNSSNQSRGNNNHNKSNKPAKASTSSSRSASIADKLGKDGKLAKEEHQRRFENNLCLYCGEPVTQPPTATKPMCPLPRPRLAPPKSRKRRRTRPPNQKKAKQSSVLCTG